MILVEPHASPIAENSRNMTDPEPAAQAGRPTCYECFRPEAHCLCHAVSSVDNQHPIVIFQHARESQHAFNTARLTALCLRQSELVVDRLGELSQNGQLGNKLAGYGLLYPHETARDISELAPEERPKGLVVIDGTWNHARTMYRDIAALRALPHFTLPTGLTSGFQIRQQPQEHCLSTLEATYFALRALEPDTPDLENLLRPFEAMQQQQLAAMRPGAGRAKKHIRARASRAIPRALIENFEDLVVAYGESVMLGQPDGVRRLVTCSALRPATGESFRAVLQMPGVGARHVEHMRLEPHDVEQGMTRTQFASAWGTFVRRRDTLAAWNQSTLDLLHGEMTEHQIPSPAGAILLKAAYHNLRRFRGSLEYILEREGLSLPSPFTPDRTGERLRNSVALAGFLHERGTSMDEELLARAAYFAEPQ